MSETAKILLVDDEPGMLRYIRTLLEVDNHKVETASTGEEAVALRAKRPAARIWCCSTFSCQASTACKPWSNCARSEPGIKVVMLSCVSDTRKVVQAIRLGAQDYLTKPFQKAELDAVIDQCLGTNKQNYPGEVEELADEVFFIAASPVMRKLRSQAALVANVDIPVLMLGESGTGKEVMARLDSQAVSARSSHIPQSQLRGGSRRSAGERTVRLRSRSLYWREPRQTGKV